MRGAKVARGGIRLSDRPDDFRTEILDLMKTQMVKNAVIVPAGAKGGFIVKHRLRTAADLGTDRHRVPHLHRRAVGPHRQHRAGRVVPPAGLLPYDEPDPYLVVAADKGTATFSDIANEIAAQHQFWLGDAFASGGALRLRPQEGRHHGARRLGMRPPSFPRDGTRRRARDAHGDRHRRHERRRVRQRLAALAPLRAARRLQPCAHFPRS